MVQPGATVQLAEFLGKTNYQDLPGPVIEKRATMLVSVPSVQMVPIVPNVLNGLDRLNVLNSAV